MTGAGPVALGLLWGGVCGGLVLCRARRVAPRGRVATLVPQVRAREVSTPGIRRVTRGLARVPVAQAVAPVAWVWTRRRHRRRERDLERAVPLVLDVLTVAARAGCTPRLALVSTARWSPPGVRDALDEVERRCRLGAALADALDDLAEREPPLRTVAEALATAERTGAPTAELLGRLADEERAALRRRAEAHARRVPVRLLFPLVFLVLPAFGLLTVVPALLDGLRGTS